MLKKTGLLLALFVFMAACKADRVIVELEDETVEAAIAGGSGSSEFQATFEFSGELDSKKRMTLSEIETIVRSKMQVDEFEVTGDGRKTQIEISGILQVSKESPRDAAWYIGVENYLASSYVVSLKVGPAYESLRRAIRAVDSSYSPDMFHPTTIRFKANGVKVTVPAGYVEGDPKIMYSTTVNGRLSMRFAKGIFDHVGAAFVYVK